MRQHKDYITHIDNLADRDVLTRKLFDVNMRLFSTSPEYKQLVLQVCSYIADLLANPCEGYTKPKGMSGANIGVPFNIIGIATADKPQVMINPRITRTYGSMVSASSNCGSLTLPAPITIKRHEFIDVEYYDTEGSKHILKKVGREHHGFTIAHEVDHNLGLLITDRI